MFSSARNAEHRFGAGAHDSACSRQFSRPAKWSRFARAARNAQCSSCRLRTGCLPAGLSREELEQVDIRLVSLRRKADRGEALFRAADRFHAVFAVWFGFFKTLISSTPGM